MKAFGIIAFMLISTALAALVTFCVPAPLTLIVLCAICVMVAFSMVLSWAQDRRQNAAQEARKRAKRG